jgi:hypothetical protein
MNAFRHRSALAPGAVGLNGSASYIGSALGAALDSSRPHSSHNLARSHSVRITCLARAITGAP